MKLFAALKPTPDIITELTHLQRSVSNAKWSAPEKLHITLGYFGEVTFDQAETLDDELAKLSMPAFDVELFGVGHFGRSEPHAIWIGVKPSDALTRLHKHCRRAARYAHIKMEARPFLPHVTLAYLRRDPDVRDVVAFEKRNANFEAEPFMVDSFALYSSQSRKNGPNIYTQEATYPLVGS